MRGEQKFRPYFTASELMEIITCLKEHSTPKRLGISRYLETFAIKIERGVLEPAITLDPTIDQKLGFSPSGNEPELHAETLYMWMRDSTKTLSPKQLKIAMDYAYRSNLLTPDEEIEYEASNGLTEI